MPSQSKGTSAPLTQSHSPIGDDGPDECPRGGTDRGSEFRSDGPGDHQAVHAFQASLHDEIDNAVECGDVDGTDDAGKEQPHHEPPTSRGRWRASRIESPTMAPMPAPRITPVGIVCLAIPRTAAGILPAI